jgi:hypothetical protein
MPHELLNPLRLTFTPRSMRLGFEAARGLYVFASVGGVVAFVLLVLLFVLML